MFFYFFYSNSFVYFISVDEGTATAKPGGMTWPGLPAGELTKEISSGKKCSVECVCCCAVGSQSCLTAVLPGVKTTKVTDVHQAVVSCRDQVYQVTSLDRQTQTQTDTYIHTFVHTDRQTDRQTVTPLSYSVIR